MGTTASTTSGLESPRAAPGRLELVRQFINTADLHPGEDELVDLEALRAWLRKRGLIAPREPLAAGDLERALALREALRTLFAVRDGDGVGDGAAVRSLNALAPAALLRVAFDRDGVPALEPVARGLEGAFAELLAIIEHAAVDGSLARLKVCADHDCRWAFYDQSKNRSRSWCNMAVCGNRAKAREYRRRHRSPAVSGGAKQ
jgi:predicted RNA-binding Zn ribbon-like protein